MPAMSSYQPATTVSAASSMSNYGNARRGVRNTTALSSAAAAAATAPASAAVNASASNVSDPVSRGAAAATNATTVISSNNNNTLTTPRTASGAVGVADGKSACSTDSVIEELKALAKSMLEATNAARRRTSSIEHRNSYEALMHAIENRVNGDANGVGGKEAIAGAPAAAAAAPAGNEKQQRHPRSQQHADPNVGDVAESELLSEDLIEQLTDIPAELSPGSRIRRLQELEQLQQQQQRSKAAKGRNVANVAAVKQEWTSVARAPAAGAATAAAAAVRAAASRVPADTTREDIAEDDVDEDVVGEGEDEDEQLPHAKPQETMTRRSAASGGGTAASRGHAHENDEDDDEDDDGTAYDGVQTQVLFKPVNRTAYQEVLASTWKPEGLTRRVPVEDSNAVKREPDDSNNSSSSGSSSNSSDGDEGREAEDIHHHHHHSENKDSVDTETDKDEEEAMTTVSTRNKTLKAAAAPPSLPTRSMKVYRVPAFPYGGGVTEQQARLLQRQFDACIQNGEHLHSNATGPKLITKAAFDAYAYDEVDGRTAQLDLKSFKPTSPYEFVVEVEREVRFDAVKAREERRRRFKRLVQEKQALTTMGTFDLRVIMDPFKTGFEEEKNFPIIPGTVIAGRYEIIQMLGKATFSRAVRCYDLQDPIYDTAGEEEDEEEEQDDGDDDDGEHNNDNNVDETGASASPAGDRADGADKAKLSNNNNSSSSKKSSDAAAAAAAAAGSEKKQSGTKRGSGSGAKKKKLVGYGQVCLKIINNTKDFFDQALDEIRLLRLLNQHRDPDEAHIVRLIDAFYYKEHVMLVTELLRDTLYDYGKYNREEEEEFYFTVPRLRRLTRQVVEALTYVHSLNLMHTDLKPENIMFVSYSRCVVKVIDFGSSCFLSDHLSSYIQSRSYRAPEVVLGCDYDGRIDVWSLGAILVEMVTGDVLFTSDTVPEMLARIVYVCGMPFPRHMLWEGRHTSDYVNKFGCIYEYGGAGDDQHDRGANNSKGNDDSEEPYCLYTPVPTMVPHTCNAPKRSKTTTAAAQMVRTPAGPYSVLREKLAAADMVDRDFISFVEACLTLDHKKRPTTEQLLNHPFIKNERV